MKKSKGITLIALIITIIVLLILAGVSISIMTGDNGVLSRAQESKEKTDRAHIEEMKQLTASRAAMNLDGYNYTDKKGVTVYIPSSFAVSENPDEQLVEDGLVVIDKYGDEFVWVPATENNFVKRKSKMQKIGDVESDSLSDDYGTNYFITSYDEEKAKVNFVGGFFVSRYEIGAIREISGNEEINYYTSWSASGDKTNLVKLTLPKLNSKKGIEPVRIISQDECLALANLWKSGKDYQSGLITGTQWDRMVSWICDAGENGIFPDQNEGEVLYDCTEWGNYKNNLSKTYKSIFTSGIVKLGSEEKYGQWIERNDWSRNEKGDNYRFVISTGEFISVTGVDTSKKNVYDVAGNVWEWTTEVSLESEGNRVVRGGGNGNLGYEKPATFRNGFDSGTESANGNLGFRVVLYVLPPDNN